MQVDVLRQKAVQTRLTPLPEQPLGILSHLHLR